MAKIRRIKIKAQKYIPLPGASPGALQLYEGALKPKITAYAYDLKNYIIREILNTAQLDDFFDEHSSFHCWVDIRGLGDLDLLNYIKNKFNIHNLVLEDITNIQQRPKLDEHDGYLFATSRMLYLNEDLEIENKQISYLLFRKVLISFQEDYNNCIEPVINRLAGGKGTIRTGGSSYLMYALMDVIIDNYFALIYKLGEELETIEELLYRKADKLLMYQTQSIKRIMISIRRAAWPERDKLNDMIRTESRLITKETKTFLKDAYDHSMQIIDLVESYRDITASLIDMNLSFISNRMNEIMKVLTIISSIFIPLTFIAGVYGMNFAYQDPQTGKVLPNNMPELYAENGYVYTMLFMFVIAVLQVIYFWRRGWLSNK
ncbi:MAG: magnesium/cobalt transporter CorA [Daejeonella sp.]